MNIKTAATNMKPKIINSILPDQHPEYGKDHLLDMVKKIETAEISGAKAHRWLGWIQGCVCMGDGATLKELKQIAVKRNIESKGSYTIYCVFYSLCFRQFG